MDSSADELSLREEARLQRALTNASKLPSLASARRSWQVKKESPEMKEIHEAIAREDAKKAHTPTFVKPNFVHTTISPTPLRKHSATLSSPTHFNQPVPFQTEKHAVNHAPHHPVQHIDKVPGTHVPEVVNRRTEDEKPIHEIETVEVVKTEEEKQKELERQVALEQERFNRYLNRTSQTHKREGSLPNLPSPPSTHVPKVIEKSPRPAVAPVDVAATGTTKATASPRQSVLLDISGPGSSKGEAGKQTSFIIKMKSSLLIDSASAGKPFITVRIHAKDASGKLVEVPYHLSPESDQDTYIVLYTPSFIGPHTFDIFVNGQPGHTFTVHVTEGGPYPLNTDATWDTIKHLTVGTKAVLVVTPMSFIKRIVPLGYSSLSAKVHHVDSNTPIKNVSVLGNKEGYYVVSFYPAQAGDHIISVTLNNDHISGSPFVFCVN